MSATKEKNPAAVALGSIRTEKKAAAARENGKLYGGRHKGTFKPLEEIRCTCPTPNDSVTLEAHMKSCLRYRALVRRRKSPTPTPPPSSAAS